MDEPSQIRALGWRQGSFLPPEFASEIRDEYEAVSELTHGIIITQDCDLLHPDLELEPIAEILWLRPLDHLDRGLRDGKSMRKLHVEASKTNAQAYFEAVPYRRTMIPRARLAEVAPDPNLQLSPTVTRTVIAWLIERYTRTGFPDEFARRLEPIRRESERLLKPNSHLLDRILLIVDPMTEIPESRNYHVDMCFIADRRCWADSAQKEKTARIAKELKDAFEQCDGVRVESFEVGSPDETPLSYLEYYAPWDAYSYLTHRANLEAEN